MLIFILLSGWWLLACSSAQRTAAQPQKLLGQVCVIGNQPFAKLAIKVENGQTYVLIAAKEIETMLLQHQGQFVQIITEGVEETPEGKALKVVRAQVLTNK